MLRRGLPLVTLVVLAAAPAASAGPLPGPTVSLVVTPADTFTARTVTAKVTATDDENRIVCVSVAWGDGTGQGVCMSGHGTGASEMTQSFTHAYRRPGAWPVSARATSETPDAGTTEGAAATIVRVLPGENRSNGPALPGASLAQNLPPGGDRRTTYLEATGQDEDGWISESTVEWGDGTRERRVYGTQGCQDPLLTWPSSRPPGFTPSHRYARAGDRTVRVTTVSVGCDGKDRQTRVQTARMQVPARF